MSLSTSPITDRLYGEDHGVDRPGRQYLLRLKPAETTHRLDYDISLSPLVRIDPEEAARLAEDHDDEVWELLSREGRHRGFVTHPQRAGVSELRRDLHLLHEFLTWQLNEHAGTGGIGFGSHQRIVLAAPILRPEADFDGYNEAMLVPQNRPVPTEYQLRPYGRPDARCRMAWLPAQAMITNTLHVLWFPDIEDPRTSDW